VTTTLEALEIRTVSLPLVEPFTTSRSSEAARELLLLRWIGHDSEGWAECAADPRPVHFAEFLASAREVIVSDLLPAVAADGSVTAGRARELMWRVPGNRLAKAALESAILDAELRACGMPLSDYLGGVVERVPVGVSVGITPDIPSLLDRVERYLAQGYRRIKLKVKPGWDVEPVAEVRRVFGGDFALQVDANESFRPSDRRALRQLDGYDLLLLEQPFPRGDLLAHARLAEELAVPICLDESITSLHSAALAISVGACEIVNIKPARVGGYLEARSIHDLCLAHGIPVFCGGVLESGVGRAANLALASLPNFSLPGDISATNRYYAHDITQRFELDDGHIAVPTGSGSGAVVDLGALACLTVEQSIIRPPLR
jgi:O-succinylbenzoate synthase